MSGAIGIIVSCSIFGAIIWLGINFTLYEQLTKKWFASYFSARPRFTAFLEGLCFVGMLVFFMLVMPIVVGSLFIYESVLPPCLSWCRRQYQEYLSCKVTRVHPTETATQEPSGDSDNSSGDDVTSSEHDQAQEPDVLVVPMPGDRIRMSSDKFVSKIHRGGHDVTAPPQPGERAGKDVTKEHKRIAGVSF